LVQDIGGARVGWGGAIVPVTTALSILSLPAAGRKKSWKRWRLGPGRSDGNLAKWTNEPDVGVMGESRMLIRAFGFDWDNRLNMDLTRFFSEWQQRITDSSVVSSQLSVAGRGRRPSVARTAATLRVPETRAEQNKELSVAGDGEVSGVMARRRRPPVASTAATFRVPETRAERGVVAGREGAAIQNRVVMRADWSRKVRIGGALLAT
jgi:hypothetical protein